MRTKRQIRPTAAILVALLVLPLLPPGTAVASYAPTVVPASHTLPVDDARSVFVSFADGQVGAADLEVLEDLGLGTDSVTLGRDGLAAIALPANMDADVLAGALATIPQVEVAAPGGVLSVLGEYLPDDDYYTDAGRFVDNEYRDALVEVYQRRFMGPQTSYPHSLQFEPAWAELDPTSTDPVRIAVLDTGYTAPSRDMDDASIIPMGDYTRRNPVTGGPSDGVADGHGHGTMVISTIAATFGNGEGLAGAVGPARVEILVYKVLRDDGTSRIEGTLDVNEAIMDAVDAGADIINCSFGDTSAASDDLGEAFQPAVDYAREHDTIVVAAAGNTGGDYVLPPAATPGVVAVGSIDYAEGTLSPFSNHGRGLDLVATGEDVPVLTADGTDVAIAHGTSFASPLVAAGFALLRSVDPQADAASLVGAVLQSADPYPSVAAEDQHTYGNGKLDVYEALQTLERGDAEPAAVGFTRHAGTSRYDTAATVSRSTYTDGAPAAVLASGEGWADALAAGVLAQSVDGPLLLVGPDYLPAATARELDRLAPHEVVVVGGPGAVSESVADAIAALLPNADVDRISGPNRYATAAAVARAAADRGGLTGGTAVLASGRDFPDALAAVPVAAHAGWPILLTEPDELARDTRTALRELGLDEVVLIGGAGVVGDDVADALADAGHDVERVHGPDRYATAREVADWAVARGILTDAELGVATGLSFPDALAGGPYMARVGCPLILADSVDGSLGTWLSGHPDIHRLHVFGGTGVVSAPTAKGIISSLSER